MILVYEGEEQEELDPCRVSARRRGDDRSLDLGCDLKKCLREVTRRKDGQSCCDWQSARARTFTFV